VPKHEGDSVALTRVRWRSVSIQTRPSWNFNLGRRAAREIRRGRVDVYHV